MIKSNCQKCGKEFLHFPSKVRKFCSISCAGKTKNQIEFLCTICQTKFFVRLSRALKYNVKYCSYKCHQIGESRKGAGAEAMKIKAETQPGGRKSYPKKNGRHIHRQIAEQILGRPLKIGEVVHHKDENKQNFSEDNIQILSSQGEHAKLHIHQTLQKRKEKHGY